MFDLEQPNTASKPLYFIPPQQRAAQAVITQVNGTKATLWLGGLDYATLGAFASGSTFTILDKAGRGAGSVTLESRQGLTASAAVQGVAERGTLLQESTRVIPNDLRLRIGIDPSLGSGTAVTALSQNRIEIVPAQPGDRPYPTGIHYILSRVTPAYRALLSTADKPPVDSVALFTPNLEVLPNSFEQAGETAQNAIKRLSPKLQSLVAAYLVRQTLNASTSNLNVSVQIHQQDRPEFIVAKAATQSGHEISTRLRSLPLKTPFQFKISNGETTPLYLLIALVSPSGRLAILFPNNYTLGDLNQVSQVAAKSTRLVPDPGDQDSFQLIPQVVGHGEALVIASRKPLDRGFKRLQTLADEQSTPRGLIRMERGTEAIADLLTDVSTRSGPSSYTISTNDIATLSIMFEIIAS